MSNCVRCNVEITDEVLRHVHYNEEFPDIDIGPYCIDCISKVRICSGCHYPFIDGETIKYYGDCLHYCDTCAENIESCDHCHRIKSCSHVIDGKKYCDDCYRENFKHCKHCDMTLGSHLFDFSNLTRAEYEQLFKDHEVVCQDCFELLKKDYTRAEVKVCFHCGAMYPVVSTSHPEYCPTCVSILPSCEDCGKIGHEVYEKRIADPAGMGRFTFKKLCVKCYNKYTKCDTCGYMSKNTVKVRGTLKTHTVCKGCYNDDLQECKHCLKPKQLVDGVCGKCEIIYFNNLCDCGSIRDDGSQCRVCNTSKIYNYTFKPHPHFNYTKKDSKVGENVFFGIENEVTMDTRPASQRALNRIYKAYDPTLLTCKTDASIPSYGFEIVTQPMTLRFFHELDLTKMFSRSYNNSGQCGTHIHVGREAFNGDSHIYKVTNFVHSNVEFIDKVAGRSYNGYNDKIKSGVSTVVLKAKKTGHAERCLRVNLRNKDTIEFRMFAGCVTERQMRYRVEFLIALVKWTEGIPLTSTDVVDFSKFVEDNKKMYPNFHSFLRLGR